MLKQFFDGLFDGLLDDLRAAVNTLDTCADAADELAYAPADDDESDDGETPESEARQ